MTSTEGTSDADAALRDAIRSIDAIGEGASGHEETSSKHGGPASETVGDKPAGDHPSDADA